MTKMTNVGEDLSESTKEPEPTNLISSAMHTQVRQMYNASSSLLMCVCILHAGTTLQDFEV